MDPNSQEVLLRAGIKCAHHHSPAKNLYSRSARGQYELSEPHFYPLLGRPQEQTTVTVCKESKRVTVPSTGRRSKGSGLRNTVVKGVGNTQHSLLMSKAKVTGSSHKEEMSYSKTPIKTWKKVHVAITGCEQQQYLFQHTVSQIHH